MAEEKKDKNEEKGLEKLFKELQEEQQRLHPEIYDKKKSGGN